MVVNEIHGLPLFAADTAPADAMAELDRRGLSDGLPTVIPTAAGLQRLVSASRGLPASAGMMPPLFGELQLEALAYQALIAGCEPSALPLLVAACQACIDDAFNLLGIATTTGTATIAVLANANVGARLGLRSGTNCLGPGCRANATIGRAMSLIQRNLGGAREGTGDMATMGQPGKYTFCFAEADTTYPGLATQLGVDAPLAGCVLGVSGTAEVLPRGNAATAADILEPVALAMVAAKLTTGARARVPEAQVLLLPQELAHSLERLGLDLDAQRAYLFAAATQLLQRLDADTCITARADDILIAVTGGPGVKMTHLPLWAGGTRPVAFPVLAGA